MTNIEVMIFCVALLGVVIGAVNLLHSLKWNRVQLTVTPKLAFDVDPGRYTTSEWNEYAYRSQESGAQKRWLIEVANLSPFGVTIDEVGFTDRTIGVITRWLTLKFHGAKHGPSGSSLTRRHSFTARMEHFFRKPFGPIPQLTRRLIVVAAFTARASLLPKRKRS